VSIVGVLFIVLLFLKKRKKKKKRKRKRKKKISPLSLFLDMPPSVCQSVSMRLIVRSTRLWLPGDRLKAAAAAGRNVLPRRFRCVEWERNSANAVDISTNTVGKCV
jgi:hypothetical protein